MWLDESGGVSDDWLEDVFDKHFDGIGFRYVEIKYSGEHASQRTVRQAIKDTRAFIAWARGGPPPAWLNGQAGADTDTYPMPKDLWHRIFDIHGKLRDLEEPVEPDADLGPRGIEFDRRLQEIGFWLPDGKQADRITGDQEAALWHLCEDVLPSEATADPAVNANGINQARAALGGQPVEDLL
jgi:hypothetical protein